MATRPGSRRAQRGAALLVFATVLILGVVWFTVGALAKAAPTAASREIRTGEALQAGKRALLAYIAQYAARFDTAEPGQLPCPESPTLANVGEASTSCSATLLNVGRLPWKTLGIDQLRDGEGEPLWYVMRGFRNAPINFSTAGLLNHNVSPVVAMIVAPGLPRNTASLAGTLAGCTKQNQLVANRNTATLNAANFLECGVATGSITSPGDSAWTNDRVITITQAEWFDAITGPIADRLQRQVAPVLRHWDDIEFAATGRSWGQTHGLPYLPFASDWEDQTSPSTTAYCGNQDTLRGLMPIDPSCYNSAWTVQSVDTDGPLDISGGGNGCVDTGTFVRCSFVRVSGPGSSANAEVVLKANNVARAFRSTLRQEDLTPSNSGSATLSMSLPNSTSDATMTVDLTWSASSLSLGQVVSVEIPHLQNAQIHADPRITWYWNNLWHRYTYYGVSPDATASNSNSWDACDAAGDPGCLTVNGLPPASGSTNDKRLVLVLSGKPLAGQNPHSDDLNDYFENQNASVGVIYEMGAAGTAFNDKVASCPFKYQNHAGTDVVICN